MKTKSTRPALLQGTLDLLVLRTLALGPLHGHGISRHIQQTTDAVLQVEHGSLYPALQRLERKGLITAKWEADERGRELKRYRLTAAGKKQLSIEESRWASLVRAVGRLLKPV